MKSKFYLIATLVFSCSLAFGGNEVTVLTSKSGEKSVVRTNDLNDSSKRVLIGWTIAGSVDEINWEKIDQSDATYIEALISKIDTEITPATILVDKNSASVLYQNYSNRPCVFTGVDGQNYGCNHYSDSLMMEKSGASLIFTIDAKWDTQVVAVLKLREDGSTLIVDAAMENAVALMDNQTIANLDSQFSRNREYGLNRDKLVNVFTPVSIESKGNSIKVSLSVESNVPKEDASFSSKFSFELSSPNGKGRLVYQAK